MTRIEKKNYKECDEMATIWVKLVFIMNPLLNQVNHICLTL